MDCPSVERCKIVKQKMPGATLSNISSSCFEQRFGINYSKGPFDLNDSVILYCTSLQEPVPASLNLLINIWFWRWKEYPDIALRNKTDRIGAALEAEWHVVKPAIQNSLKQCKTRTVIMALAPLNCKVFLRLRNTSRDKQWTSKNLSRTGSLWALWKKKYMVLLLMCSQSFQFKI